MISGETPDLEISFANRLIVDKRGVSFLSLLVITEPPSFTMIGLVLKRPPSRAFVL